MTTKPPVFFRILLLCLLVIRLTGCADLEAEGDKPTLSGTFGDRAITQDNVTSLARLSSFGNGQALSVNIDPTGSWMVVRTTAGVYLYDALTWELHDFSNLGKQVSHLAFSPDGRYLALAMADTREVQIRQLPDGRLLSTLPAGESALHSIAFLPQGETLIINSFRAISVWQVTDTKLVRTIKPPEGTQFLQAEISPDGSYLAVPLLDSAADKIVVWQLSENEPVAKFRGNTKEWFTTGKFLTGGSQFAALMGVSQYAALEKLLIWDLLAGTPATELSTGVGIAYNSWVISPDGMRIATGHVDGSVVLWSSVDGSEQLTLPAPVPAPAQALRITGDSRLLIAIYANSQIGVWSLPDGKLQRLIDLDTDEAPAQVVLHPDDLDLVMLMPNGRISVWNLDEGQEETSIESYLTGEVRGLAFSPDNRFLVVGSANGMVQLWQTTTGEVAWQLPDHQGRVDSVAFSTGGESLATGIGERISALSFDDTIRVWKTANESLQWQLAGEKQDVVGCTLFRNRVAFTPDGSLLAATSHDFSVQLWRMDDGSAWKTLTGHTQPVLDLDISPDGEMLASVSLDGTVRLWRVADGSYLRTIDSESLGLQAVAFSPDGQRIAAGSFNGDIYLWEIKTGDLLWHLEGQMNTPATIAFSIDGSLLAAGHGNTLQLWTVGTGQLVDTLPGEHGDIENVTFSKDGRLLAIGSEDGIVELWEVP